MPAFPLRWLITILHRSRPDNTAGGTAQRGAGPPARGRARPSCWALELGEAAEADQPIGDQQDHDGPQDEPEETAAMVGSGLLQVLEHQNWQGLDQEGEEAGGEEGRGQHRDDRAVGPDGARR